MKFGDAKYRLYWKLRCLMPMELDPETNDKQRRVAEEIIERYGDVFLAPDDPPQQSPALTGQVTAGGCTTGTAETTEGGWNGNCYSTVTQAAMRTAARAHVLGWLDQAAFVDLFNWLEESDTA